MIIRKEFQFSAANGGDDIFCCFWFDEDNEKYKAIIQIAHGMAEHILRYEEFAVFLAKQGFIVCGNDHAGHGRSVLDTENMGYFGKEDNSWNYLIYDMHYLNSFMKKRYPDLQCFLLGHSMGSFLSRQYALKYGEELKGAVFLGTAHSSHLIDAAIALSKEGIKLKGPKEKGHIVNKMAFGAFNLKCIPLRTEYDWICSDESVVKRFMSDEKCGFLFSYAGYRDLFQLLKEVSKEQWFEGIDKKLPVLIISGKDDPVGEYGRGCKKVYEKLLAAGCENVIYKLYENDRHEVLNEKNNASVYRFILKWLNELL